MVVDRRRVFAAVALTLALAGWQSAIAGAKVYCVAPATGCSGGTQPSLQAALTQVQADGKAGQIELGASTYTSPTTAGFVYSGTAPLEIDGTGASTTLALPPNDNSRYVLASSSTAALTLRGLRLLFSSGSTNDSGLKAIGPATIVGVSVDGSPAATPSVGIILDGGGSVSTSTVTVPADGLATGLQVNGSSATTVQDSTLGGVIGAQADGPGLLTIHRCILTGTSSGSNRGVGLKASGGSVVADDTLVESSGTNAQPGMAVEEVPSSTTAVTVTATQLTIAGNASDTGVLAQTLSSGDSSLMNLSDSIIAEPLAFSIYEGEVAGAQTSVAIDYSDFDPSTVGVLGASFTSGAHDVPSYVTPGFANPGSDFRLVASSPLLNFDPTPLGHTPVGASESATDLAGAPRITGTGRDLGAYQHQPPAVTASEAPSPVGTGTAVRFTASGATSTPGATLGYSWRLDDGASATGASVAHAFATPGLHSATVTVTDSTGLTATATASVSVVAAPAISGARQSHAKWRKTRVVGRHGVPVGTTFSFTLSEPATVRLAFTQRVPGRRLGKRCVAQTRRNRHRGRCTRTVTAAVMSFSGEAGVNRIPFKGRSLAPGRYTVAITAANAFGERSAPRTLTFVIVKR